MKFVEFFLGTNEERKAQLTIREIEARSRILKRDAIKLTQAKRVTRRLALRRLGIGIGGAILFSGIPLAISITDNRQNSKESGNIEPEKQVFPDLSSYRNSELPQSLSLVIANDLVGQKEYPSLVRSGNFLLENVNDPNSSRKYDSVFVRQDKPVAIQFKNLGTTVAMYGDFGDSRTTDAKVALKRKESEDDLSFMGLTSESNILYIYLSNGLLDVHASPWVMRAMIAKEASHPFYFTTARTAMLNDVRKKYDVPEDKKLEDILMATALSANDPRLKIPFISTGFNRMGTFIDYAGYGHVALDIASMRERHLLSPKDLEILASNLLGIDMALERGLIKKDPINSTKFVWSDGISLYSQPWFDVMDKAQALIK